MFVILPVLEAVVLASSCSLDAFTAGFAYGSNQIKIPFLSNQVINVISTLILGISLWIGAFVRQYLPGWLTAAICFLILLVLGISKLLDSVTKSIIRKHNKVQRGTLNKEIRFSAFNFHFILNLYANPEDADVDANKVISPAEAAVLAVSLSLDGLALGFGAALGNVNILVVLLTSLVANTVSVMLGCWLGNKAASKLPVNLSWLSGVVLVGMAFLKLG